MEVPERIKKTERTVDWMRKKRNIRKRRESGLRKRGGLLSAALLVSLSVLLLSRCGESREAKEARLQGIAQMEAGQYEDAVASFETALKHGDGVVDEFELDILKYRGEAEYLLGDYEAAAYTYGILAEVDGAKREYLEYKNSAEVQVKNQQGVRLLEEEKPEEALALFEEGLALLQKTDSNVAAADSLEAAITYNIGAVYEAQGDFAKALDHFRSYVSVYGSAPELEKEIAFLESRQNGGEEWQN